MSLHRYKHIVCSLHAYIQPLSEHALYNRIMHAMHEHTKENSFNYRYDLMRITLGKYTANVTLPYEDKDFEL